MPSPEPGVGVRTAEFVEVGGLPVRYAATGTGPPVILLHGLGRSLEDWEPLRAALSGYRLIAIDLAGFGQSQPLPDCRLASLARHVEGTLDMLGVPSGAHVVGNSLGGAVAMRLATGAPHGWRHWHCSTARGSAARSPGPCASSAFRCSGGCFCVPMRTAR
ncbi:alpha/beta fold hydrolase [Streptomyces sp. BE308]|uniref:alpha/beta fold hydrolase n=1 Tax=Streptomyces sp. BE308 TaxID=3002529 RepID=UPI002E78EBC1|nr:alpha/beta fold hydrolase [Streptomyces sp. BE308]MEE1793036.1 alpha/beta fold hydrolase [Streptomyces sp. BE308]